MKRLLSMVPSEMTALTGQELAQAILASEGRTILAETVVNVPPMLGSITNAELAASFGADMILLNAFDCLHPHIGGLPESDDPVRMLRKLCGRPVGANLEPVDEGAPLMEDRDILPPGRRASRETFEAAEALGLQFICLTGNPGTGVTNRTIAQSVKLAKEHFSGLIIAGKMHAAGVNEPLADPEVIDALLAAGADVILLPAVNTVPGVDEETIRAACRHIREKGKLSLLAIGTAQETSDPGTIREIALCGKRCGGDILHIGDSGWGGLAFPENIAALSIAARGKRHTYFRMAQSPLR